MTTTLTPYLKLRVSPELTPDASYNLYRIDTVGSTIFVTNTGNANLWSQGTINILPNSPDVGGTGTGGTLNVSISDQPLDLVAIYADDVTVSGNLSPAVLLLPDDVTAPTYYSGLKASNSLTGDTIWTLPTEDGAADQVITTDGAGQLGWTTILTSNLPQNNVRVGDGSAQAVNTDTSAVGDILADSTTGLTYKAGSIVNADISASALIARSKLSLGTADHVLINSAGGSLSSEAQLAITRGGTGAATAAAARTNLGLEIGTDVQAWNTQLDTIAAITPANDEILVGSGGSWIVADPASYYSILGLGTIATQDSDTVAITGGSIDDTAIGNITPAAVAATTFVTTSGSLDVDSAKALTIGATVGANDLTLGESTSTVVIPGNLTVQGTTTTVDTDTLAVADANITMNNGGDQSSANGTAGLTVTMSDATDVSLIYSSAAATRWLVGDLGSEVEIVDISTAQTLTNKTIPGSRNAKATWAPGDGATKTVVHSFGNSDVRVEVYDIDSGETEYPDSVVRTDSNTVDLVASVAPTGSGWRVLITEVGT